MPAGPSPTSSTATSGCPGSPRAMPRTGSISRWCTPSTPSAFDDAEGVEGVHHRDIDPVRGIARGDPGHPEVAVEDVGLGPAGIGGHPVGEFPHVWEQIVLGDGFDRAGVDVHDLDVQRHRYPLIEVRVVTAGIDGDVVAAASER